MKITSPLSPDNYLAAMKEKMATRDSAMGGLERFSGLFMGRCFYVTHHSEHDFEHRRPAPLNAAIGYVKPTADGCQITYFTARGNLCPGQFLFLFITLTTMLIIASAITESTVNVPDSLITGFLCILIFASITTLIECTTERSEEGKKTLIAFLNDPENTFC